MDKQEIIDRLHKLNRKKVMALQLRVSGLSLDQIVAHKNMDSAAESTVKGYFTDIYKLFGVKDWDQLRAIPGFIETANEVFAPHIGNKFISWGYKPEESLEYHPPQGAGIPVNLPSNQGETKDTDSKKEADSDEDTPPPGYHNFQEIWDLVSHNWRKLLITFGIFLAFLLLLRMLFPGSNSPVVETQVFKTRIVVTEIVTEVVKKVITQEFVTPIVLTRMVEVEPPTATVAPRLTDTLQPTNTPSPVPTPAVVLFQNDFVNGVDPRWQIQGNYFLVDGALNADGEISLSIPAEWTDYQVSIKYDNWRDYYSGTIGLRTQPNGDMVTLKGGPGRSNVFKWGVVKNGQYKEIPNGGFSVDTGNIHEITLQVKGNDFLIIGGKQVTVSEFENGGLYLKLWNGAILHSITVTALAP